jgi:Na+/H+ antiporter NhaD/arsenite permease-like protein
MEGVTLPIAVFVAVYVAITFELLNKAVASVLGVMVLLAFHVVDVHEAVQLIDAETIMLLLGMMCIVAILRKSGIFTILSVKIAELTKGSSLKILILFSLVTAAMSALLDNVTTVLIIIPIVIELTIGMGLNPRLFVISQAMISNIGGTATLIGDPPNIIIGSKVGLTFNQFAINLFIPVALSLATTLAYLWATNRETFRPVSANLSKLFSTQLLLEKIRLDFLNTAIDPGLLIKGVLCLVLATGLFVTQTITKLSPGVVAMLVAMFLFSIARPNVESLLEEIEWSTLLFFAGLFVLVGILEQKGVIEWIARNVFLRIGDNPYVIVLTVLWATGLISGFLDNIPFTITMIPVVRLLGETTPVPHNIMWWALALGACLGGNLTMVGASANIVSVGIARQSGVAIRFLDFMKTSAAVTLLTLVVASTYLSIYLWLTI